MRRFENTNGIEYQLRRVINKYHKSITMYMSKTQVIAMSWSVVHPINKRINVSSFV